MELKELVQKDKSFNSELFISKANNMIKKIYTAITNNELEKVNHFISDKVYIELKKQIDNADSKNCIIEYNELSVNTGIYDIKEINNEYVINTDVEIRCIRYIKDKGTNTIIGGNKDNKITIDKVAVFKKKINNNETTTNRCQGCGTSFNIIDNGICPVCGRVYDLEEVDYYIDELK